MYLTINQTHARKSFVHICISKAEMVNMNGIAIWRRVIGQTHSSFYITLPIEWIRANEINPGTPVIIRINQEGVLTIEVGK